MKETLSEDRLVFWDLKAEGLKPLIAPPEDLKSGTVSPDGKNIQPSPAQTNFLTQNKDDISGIKVPGMLGNGASGDTTAETPVNNLTLEQKQKSKQVLEKVPAPELSSENAIFESATKVTDNQEPALEFGVRPEQSAVSTVCGWHLRKKRADVFIDQNSRAPYLESLCSYLKSKGISILAYDPELHYLSYDVILADKNRLGNEGRQMALDDKGRVWEFLKKVFGARLS